MGALTYYLGMPTTHRPRPIRVEIGEQDFMALLKGAAKGSAHRLAAASHDAGTERSFYVFEGSRPEVLLLRALALLHAPAVVRAIDTAKLLLLAMLLSVRALRESRNAGSTALSISIARPDMPSWFRPARSPGEVPDDGRRATGDAQAARSGAGLRAPAIRSSGVPPPRPDGSRTGDAEGLLGSPRSHHRDRKGDLPSSRVPKYPSLGTGKADRRSCQVRREQLPDRLRAARVDRSGLGTVPCGMYFEVLW